MEIFKELKKLDYKHYSANTIEELDDLSLNSAERISEQALVLRWFRNKYALFHSIKTITTPNEIVCFSANIVSWKFPETVLDFHFNTYEEAELACLKKLIEIVKNEKI